MKDESKYSTTVDYLDFELEIGPGSGQHYDIRVLGSIAGEAHEVMTFPFSDLALENQLLALQNALLHRAERRRRIRLPEEQAVQSFGQKLFEALLTGEVRSRYAVSQREAILKGKGLRVKLRIQSPLLAALPWEFLYDPEQAEYVCLSRSTPLVRYLELPCPPQPLTVVLPFRILGMIASPQNLAQLDNARERERVERALKPLQERGTVQLTWLEGQTWQDLQRAMRHGSWHVFHFIGHGGFDDLADEGLIALSDETGQANLLNATLLGRLLADHWPLRFVILNSCEGARGGKRDIFSSTAATLVRRGIPAVLAMQYEITDQAAIELSRAFYEAVVDGMPVDAALTEARKAVSLALVNTLEWGTPVLYMRSPNGVLFETKVEESPLPQEEEQRRRQQEERGRQQEEEQRRRQQEEERRQQQEEERRHQEERERQKEEQRRRQQEERGWQQEEEQRRRQQEERGRQQEEEQKRQQEERGRQQEEEQRRRRGHLYRRLALILLLLAALIGIILLSAITDSTLPTPPPGSGTDVHMGETNFIPQSVTISVGSSINLIDDTSVTYNIQNGTWEGNAPKPGPESGAPEVNMQFESASQIQSIGPFNTAGTFHYFCTNRPGMNLTVTVQ